MHKLLALFILLTTTGVCVNALCEERQATYHFRLQEADLPAGLKVGAVGDLLYEPQRPQDGQATAKAQEIAKDVKVTCVRKYEGQFPASCASLRGDDTPRDIQVCVQLPYEQFLRINDTRGWCTFRPRPIATDQIKSTRLETHE